MDAGVAVSLQRTASSTAAATGLDTPLFKVPNGATLTVTTSEGNTDSLLTYEGQTGPFVSVLQGGKLTIAHGTFKSNKALYGAVVRNGWQWYKPNLTYGTRRYEDDYTTDAAFGGTVAISGGVFEANEATADYFGGGAIYSYTEGAASESGSLTISGGTFKGNISNANNKYYSGQAYYDPIDHFNGAGGMHGGGAVYVRQGNTIISGGTFDGNEARSMSDNVTNYAGGGGTNYGGGGGAIYIANQSGKKENGQLTLSGATFQNNRSTGSGGAVMLAWNIEAKVNSGTFENNEAEDLGGAIYTEETSTTTFLSSAAWGNTAAHFGGGLWLCPSGAGITSRRGNIALFDNSVNKSLDTMDATKNQGVAGDDFALMYPTKNGIVNSSYMLSNTWYNGVNSVTWYVDGQPTWRATGFGSLRENPYGGWWYINVSNAFEVSPDVPRYQNGATTNTVYPEGLITLTQHTPVSKITADDHGIALKAVVNEGIDTEWIKGNAKVKFTGNKAYLSGGAIGTNGTVVFGNNSVAEWTKVNEKTGETLSGASWTLTTEEEQAYAELNAEEDIWKGATDAQKENAWTKDTQTGVWTAVVEDNYGQKGYHGYDVDPTPGKILVENLANNTAYKLTEKTAPTGYAVSSKTYTFTSGSGQGKGVPQVYVDGSAVKDNKIGDTPLPSIPDIQLKAKKTLDGKAPGSRRFDFLLEEQAGKSGAYTYTTLQTKENDDAGNVAFDPIEGFTSEETHVYRISEKAGDVTDIAYDTTAYFVKVETKWGYVKDGVVVDEGTAGAIKNLVASVTYYSDEDCTNPIQSAVYPEYAPAFNNESAVSFAFTKVDGSSDAGDAALAGATFALFKSTDGQPHADELVDADNPGAKWQQVGKTVTTQADGLVTFGNLAKGVYRLVEVSAPTGYQLPNGQWTVTVNPDAATPAEQVKVEKTNAGYAPPAFSKVDETAGYSATNAKLPNYKGFALPASGASGVWLSGIAGLVLIAASLAAGYLKLRGERS